MTLFEITSDDNEYPNSYKTGIIADDDKTAKEMFCSQYINREITNISEIEDDGIVYDCIKEYEE